MTGYIVLRDGVPCIDWLDRSTRTYALTPAGRNDAATMFATRNIAKAAIVRTVKSYESMFGSDISFFRDYVYKIQRVASEGGK